MKVYAEAGGRFSLRQTSERETPGGTCANFSDNCFTKSRVGAFDNLLSGQTQSRERNTKQETGSVGGGGGREREREGSHRR